MSKRLYTGFSFFEFIWTLCLRVACVLALVYVLPHYDENPVVISVVAGFCCLFILIIGDDQIVIYSDKIIQSTNSFSALIFRLNNKTYKIENIKFAYLQTIPKSSVAEIGAASLAWLVLPKYNTTRKKNQAIYFDLKNGETAKFETTLENYKVNKIVEIVNSLTK